MATIKEKLQPIFPHTPEHGTPITGSYGLMREMAKRGLALPYISYQPRGDYRSMQSPGWHVVFPGRKTDPYVHWMHHGNRFFYLDGTFQSGTVPQGIDAAIDWTNENYGTTEWVKISGFPRDWFPAEVLAEVKRIIKESK